MRLSDLFEDAETSQKERQFQDAWTAAGPMLKAKGIPPAYYGRVQSRAHELAISYKQDVDDAISTAASEMGAKISKKSQVPTSQQTQKSKEITPYSKQSRSGKRWGNQYYSDPAKSGGVKGALAKASPKAIAKKAVDKVDNELGDLFDIEKALSGNSKRRG
jgi:hypothetical protein